MSDITATVVDVHLLETATGRRAVYRDEYAWRETLEFQWSEGNYGCDCNRSLFFHRALNIDEPEDPACGENAFKVEKIVDLDGKVLFDGDPKTAISCV